MRIDYPRRAKQGWRRFVPSWRQLASIAFAGVVALAGVFVALYLLIDLPQPNELAVANSSVVYYSNGKTELGRYAEVNRDSVPLSEVPLHVQQAVLAAEDRTFYDNRGISFTGIGRSIWNNLSGGDTQGGSTITQQYARNAYLTQERTYERKVKEAILALKLNRELSKDQILEDYLNTIYFGRNAYGIEAASQAYFRTSVSRLTVAQGAVLAALIRAPASYDPAEGDAAAAALETRTLEYVIPGMVDEGWLDPGEAAALTMPKVKPAQRGNQFAGPNGYILDDYVRSELQDLGFSNQELETGGLSITVTIDKDAQAAAVAAVQDNAPTIAAERVQTGLVSVEPGTGAVRAMYGGRDYLKRFVNNATALQEPGSTFKAFTLAAALEDGVMLTDTFDGSSPWTDPATGQQIENQGDSGGTSFGPVSLLTATEESINTAYLDLTDQIGPDLVIDAAVAAGIPKNAPGLAPVPAVTLGNASVSPLQMAEAYATFAASGLHADAYVVQEVKNSTGGVVYAAEPSPDQAFAPDIADEVNYALQEVVKVGTGTTALALGRPAAGKTGTHELYTSWFVGYTPQLATAVMYYRGVGPKQEICQSGQTPESDRCVLRPTLVGVGGLPVFYGGQYPARVWTAFMTAALSGQPVEPFAPAPSPVVTTPPPSKSPKPTPTTSSPSPTPTTSSPTPTPTTTPTPSATTTTTPPEGQAGRVGVAAGG